MGIYKMITNMGTYLVIMHIVMYVHIHYTILERRTKKKGVDVRTTYTPM